jgi:hypothetical protein
MIWLHIGLPKTGSSAIQAYLRRQRDQLSSAGIFYAPGPKEEEDAGWTISSGNGVRLGRQLSETPEPVYDDDPLGNFVARFVSPDHAVSLVSSEHLAGARPERLARLKQGLKDRPVRILALVRDFYGHAFSMWHQSIKRSGYAGTFGEFARQYNDPQSRVLETYAQVFGPEALKVVHYDSSADRLIPATCEAMGLEPPADASAPVVNRSLTPVEAAVLAECNRLHGGAKLLSTMLSNHLIYKHPERITRPELDAEAAALIAERCGPATRRINERYFDGRPLLSAEPPRPEASSEETSPEAVWRDIAEALLAANAEAAKENRELTLTNLVIKARERFRKGEADAGNALLQRALAIDPEHAQAKAMAARAKAGAFSR